MKKSKELLKAVRKLVESSFSDGKIIERKVITSVKILKSLPKSQSIFATMEFLKGLKRKEREHTMYIETVIPLSTIQVKKMKKVVEKRVKITKVLVNINKELLGGLKMRVGDEIWDGSVLGSINQVRKVIHG